jgi:hypothetical protein
VAPNATISEPDDETVSDPVESTVPEDVDAASAPETSGADVSSPEYSTRATLAALYDPSEPPEKVIVTVLAVPPIQFFA